MKLGMPVGLGPGHIVLDWNPAEISSPKRGRSPPVFYAYLLWPNCWMDQDVTWQGSRPQPKRHCVNGDQAPLSERGQSPQFSARVYCGQTAGWIKMPLGRQVGLSQSDCVSLGPRSPLPKTGAEPPIFGRVYCGETAGWIKMPLGAEVGLGPGHIVLDGDPALPSPKVHSPQSSAHMCCGQMAGWIKMPLGREIGLSQATLC